MSRFAAKEFIRPHLVVVEGTDDANVVVGLLAQLSIESVQVIEVKGYTNLAPQLPVFRKTSGFSSVERIGILVDSDSDPAGRLQSIRTTLTNSGLAAPTSPMVLGGAGPAVVYSTVPGPGQPGCLEDTIAASLAGTHNAACVDQHLACVGVANVAGSSKWSKAWVHTQLSSNGQPGLKIGEAVTAKLIDLTHPAFDDFRAFLKLLTAT